MELNERLDEAKSQADSALAILVLSGGVAQRVEAGEERLEQVFLFGFGHALTFVGDLDAKLVGGIRLGAGFEANRAAVGRELDCVGQ